MRPRSFCDTRSIRSNCFPGAGLIRSHRCKRRRCTDGLPQSCTVAQEAADQPGRRRNVCLPAAAPSAPWSNDRHDLRGIEDGGRAVAPCRCHPAPQPSCFRSPAIRPEAGKPRFSPAKRCASPQTGIRSPLPAVLSLHLSPTAKAPRPVPGTTRDPTGKIAEGRSGRWVIGQARHTKKTPSR